MKKSTFIILILLVTLVFLNACKMTHPKLPSAVKTSSPMTAKLSLSDRPLLNIPVTLTLNFNSVTDAKNTSAEIILPEGFELIRGDLIWQGDLKANEEQKIEAVIKSTKIGYYQLEGTASSRQPAGFFCGTAIVFVEILQDDAIIGSKPENKWGQEHGIPIAENNEQIQSELIFSQKPELNKKFTITYQVTSLVDLPEAQVNLVFPSRAFEIINIKFPEGGTSYEHENQLSWNGNINKEQTIEIKTTFKVISTGSGILYGSLSVQPNGVTDFINDVKSANLYVDKYVGRYEIE